MAKKPVPPIKTRGECFNVSKKTLSTFKDLFQTAFNRRLTTLFTAFAEDDFYILSDQTPHLLMSGNSRGSFGFVNLKNADEEVRTSIRKMILGLVPGEDYAVRTDYLVQLINNYKDKEFPLPIDATNSDRENVYVFWRRPNIANLPVNRIQALIADKDLKDPNKRHLCQAAWDTTGGYFRHPLNYLRELFQSYINNDLLTADFVPGHHDEDILSQGFSFAGNDYRIVPVLGVDMLNLEKLKHVKGSRILLKEESSRIFSYASYAVVGDAEIMITRPDIILFPITRSTHVDKRTYSKPS